MVVAHELLGGDIRVGCFLPDRDRNRASGLRDGNDRPGNAERAADRWRHPADPDHALLSTRRSP